MGSKRCLRLLMRLHGEERGFTLVEIMVTIGILLVALLALAYTATIGFTDISLARQRQSATGLANQTMEQVRALPFDTLKKGLGNTDLATADPNITVTGSAPNTVYTFKGEEIPHGDNASVTPLVPHRADITIGPTAYHRSVYVTYFQNNKTTNQYRVTVIVTWDNPARAGASSEVEVETVVFSPTGCLSTATHPFAAPCQPFLYGSAAQDIGAVTISGTINGIQLDDASLFVSRASSELQVEQTSSTLGTSRTSGVDLALTGQANQVAGTQSASSGADSDPATPGIDYQNASVPTQSATTLSTTGGGNTLSLTTSANDTGSTTSTTSASTPTHPCADRTGANQNDSQPCGSTNSRQMGTSSAALAFSQLGTATLASLGAGSNPSVAFTNREVQTGQDGRIHSDLDRSLGTLTIGGLPSALSAGAIPAGWGGYLVRVTGFNDSVTAEIGSTTAAPTVSTAGTISYWNGAGYSTLSLAAGNPVNVPVAAVHIQDPPSGVPPPIQNVDITASLTTGGTTKNDPANCGGSCARTKASAASKSPLVGTVSYKVTSGGSVIADITITIDLGSIVASGSYTAAPSA